MVDNLPRTLKPYLFHGIDLDWRGSNSDNVYAECLWCGQEKFSVKVSNGVYKCWNCDVRGNAHAFLEAFWKLSDEHTTDYKSLARSRKLINPDTLMMWGVCQSYTQKNWLVPGYDETGKLQQLYKYTKTKKGTMALLGTSTINQKMTGIHLFNKNKPRVIICEGAWDAMAVWEVVRQCRHTEDGLIPTANESASLYSDTNVIGIPGCNTFVDKWATLLIGKEVHIWFDSDRPKTNSRTGKTIPPAGFTFAKKLAEKLSGRKKPPESIHYLCWGKNGFDEELPDSTDARDFLNRKFETNGQVVKGRSII